MSRNLSLDQFSNSLFRVSLFLLAVSLPLSEFGTSISQFGLALAFILHSKRKERLIAALNNRFLWVIWSVYLIHIAGLLHTSNFEYALKDLRIKLPLLLLPFLIASAEEITVKDLRKILLFTLFASLFSSLASFAVWLGFTERSWSNIRDISVFISHIRLSLLCCFSVFIALDFYRYEKNKTLSLLYLASVIWFISFLIILQSLTGIIILGLAALIGLLVFGLKKSGTVPLRVISLVVVVASLGLTYKAWKIVFVDSLKPGTHYAEPLPQRTKRGHGYSHEPARPDTENGHLVWEMISDTELDSVWKKRSSMPFFRDSLSGTDIRSTIIRYLASKGLPRDADGLAELDQTEIKAIEKGTANYLDLNNNGLLRRLHLLGWEYQQYCIHQNPSGHQLTQRIEFSRVGLSLIRNSPMIGCGTGDIDDEMKKAYGIMGSKLSREWQLRPHNQYITLTATLGIPALILFLFSWCWPVLKRWKQLPALYFCFLGIALLSMLWEDTLETQTGATLLAFYPALFLLGRKTQAKTG